MVPALNGSDAPCYISRLNIDPLRLVFEIVADLECPSRINPTVGGCWMRIGHVCHLWRSILLDMPPLWARDLCAFGVHGTFDAILERTRAVPLHLDLRRDVPDNTLTRLAPLLLRASVLRCTIRSPEDYHSIASTLISEKLSLLQDLAIDVDALVLDEIPTERTIISETCSIRHLQMRGVVVGLPLTGTLTSLVIGLSELNPIRRFTLNEITDVLSRNAAIEFLALNLAIHTAVKTTHTSQLLLPELSQLTIHQDHGSPFAFELLTLLLLPSVAHLHVTDGYINTAALTTSALSRAISCFAHSSELHELSMKLDRGLCEDPTPHLDTYISPVHERGIRWETEAPFRFGLFPDHHHDPTTAPGLLHAALHQLSANKVSDRVTRLMWYPWGSEAHSSTYWLEGLRHFPNVISLMVADEKSGLDALFDALGLHAVDHNRLLPCLNDLSIECYEGNKDALWAPGLESMLCRRLAVGSPISVIRVQNLFTPTRRKVYLAEYNNVCERMRTMARALDAKMAIEEWTDVFGDPTSMRLGTSFTFSY